MKNLQGKKTESRELENQLTDNNHNLVPLNSNFKGKFIIRSKVYNRRQIASYSYNGWNTKKSARENLRRQK